MCRIFTLKCTHLSAKNTHYNAKGKTVLATKFHIFASIFPFQRLFCRAQSYPLPFARSAEIPSVLRALNHLELVGGREKTHEGGKKIKNYVWPIQLLQLACGRMRKANAIS